MSGGIVEIERLRELAGIGAGRAATALAALLQRSVRSDRPRIERRHEPRWPRALAIRFDVHGGPGGVLAVLFPDKEMDTLLDAMLGAPEPERVDQVESALEEVGNILVSHALSAVADVLGTAVVPSVPCRALGAELGGAPRVEVALEDPDGSVHGVLVWLPGASSALR